MANKVVLDAMIKRADFAQRSDPGSIELGDKLMMEQIAGSSPMMKLLRKPDFQRETNQWSPQQVASLVKSFADGELIPALILWKSDSFVFVIDGAHRLSALKAWAENDYGDGPSSFEFFDREIPEDQKKKAASTRRLVEREVGRYADLKALTETDLDRNDLAAKRATTIFTRSLHVQWIQGNQEVAESSFFKINSQGTPLDSVEELLLRNRRKSYAISARSIVRSGTGHKYWSVFEGEIQAEVEKLAKELNELLFQPDLHVPIKTLDLPLGGTSSPIDALKMLVDIFALVDGYDDPKKAFARLADDVDGTETNAALKRIRSVVDRVTGNSPASLGLHPAVYFYTEQGKHSRFLFLGTIKAISEKIKNNDKAWFRKFSEVRSQLEEVLISRKSLINQALANINSRQRIQRVADLVDGLVKTYKMDKAPSDNDILKMLGLEGATGDLRLIEAPKGFSTETKSAVFLQEAIRTAVKCKVCGGLLIPEKSVSYDHHQPIRDGGRGQIENAQLTHPFCNTGIKS